MFDWFTQWRRKRICKRDGCIFGRGKPNADGTWVKTCGFCGATKLVKRRAGKAGK